MKCAPVVIEFKMIGNVVIELAQTEDGRYIVTSFYTTRWTGGCWISEVHGQETSFHGSTAGARKEFNIVCDEAELYKHKLH